MKPQSLLRPFLVLLVAWAGWSPAPAQIPDHELTVSPQLVEALNTRNYAAALEILQVPRYFEWLRHDGIASLPATK